MFNCENFSEKSSEASPVGKIWVKMHVAINHKPGKFVHDKS